MIKAFDGIHGRIAVALAVPGLALVTAAGGAGGATAHDWRGHPARVAGATPPGPARPGAGMSTAVVTTAFSADESNESVPAKHLRARTHRARTHRAPRRRARIDGSPRQIARWLLVHRFHWRRWQFHYLNLLWDRESGWNSRARNPYSGAYGIPQAVPGTKMASAGPDWQSNARTQIRWGMRYIQDRYRTPYWAWRHEVGDGWY